MEAVPNDAVPQPTEVRDGVSAAFAELALDLHEAEGAEATIDQIIEYSRDALRSDEAGVLLIHARRRVEVVSSTSADVTQAHLLQVELDEGPCLDASEDPTRVFRIDDARTDRRWPRWGKEVAALGYSSILAAPLATRTRRYGSINMYSHEPNAFDEADEDVAMILARHASVALAASHNIDGLRESVDGRKLIGIATGIVMARYSLDDHTAFEVLRRYSQAENLKLRTVAERIVAERGLPAEW
ncbi:MAG: GAF and ANTAR domain-containing protein [Aeromicrobium sp.]